MFVEIFSSSRQIIYKDGNQPVFPCLDLNDFSIITIKCPIYDKKT